MGNILLLFAFGTSCCVLCPVFADCNSSCENVALQLPVPTLFKVSGLSTLVIGFHYLDDSAPPPAQLNSFCPPQTEFACSIIYPSMHFYPSKSWLAFCSPQGKQPSVITWPVKYFTVQTWLSPRIIFLDSLIKNPSLLMSQANCKVSFSFQSLSWLLSSV